MQCRRKAYSLRDYCTGTVPGGYATKLSRQGNIGDGIAWTQKDICHALLDCLNLSISG
jgi:hypothetical protein